MLTALVAGVVCAAVMAVFTWWYLPTHALSLAAFAAVTSFALVFVIGSACVLVRRSAHA
jgi:hypothetical protein